MVRVAWLYEDGDDCCLELYREYLPCHKIDFYRTPAELLPKVNDGYDLFILGMVCPTEPYTPGETDNGFAVGLRLARDIRANAGTAQTPILISTTVGDIYGNAITGMDLHAIIKPWTKEELIEAVDSLLGQ